MNDVLAGLRKMADARLCSAGPMQYAIEPALNGDRSHQADFARALKLRAELTTSRISAIS